MTTAMRSVPVPAGAQDVPAEYQQALTTLGKQGDFKDNVLTVDIPRNDVKVTVAGVVTPTPLGFGGWVAPAGTAPATSRTARLVEIVGAQGEQPGAVYQFTPGRNDKHGAATR
jgi:Domain of Unknown Function (DUF1259)